ncbi:hypothetical protein IJT10_03440 [bacterium]|nr:hypothetical protein [bacterium]
MSNSPAYGLKKNWLALIVLLCILLPIPTWAGKPTVSGLLKSYNPGGNRLQLLRDDGTVKTVIMRPGCQFMVNGEKASSSAFRINMRVCVRICGSVMSDPLECDLIADYLSSKNVVSRHASTPNPSSVGGYASTGGPAATLASIYATGGGTPNMSGPLGLGGRFNNDPTTNPNQPNLADPSNPYQQGTAAPGAVQPTGTTVGPGMYSGGVVPGAGNPANMNNGLPINNPYASNNFNNGDLINLNNDDDEDDRGSFIPQQSGSPFAMQIANFAGQIINLDPNTRSVAVLPAGQNQPIQVMIPPMVQIINSKTGQAVDMKTLQPGAMISVQGLTNSAGIIEARQVQVSF